MNSRIITALVAGCAMAAVLVSCDKNHTDVPLSGEGIAIVSNDLLFPAQGSTATVRVQAAGNIAATVSDNWCTATVSGNLVSVTAQPNDALSGRTAMLTITAGKASRQLPIQQQGMVLDLPLLDNGHHSPVDGDVFTVSIAHNVPLQLRASHEWIHPVSVDNGIRVTVDSNAGGHIRRGKVYVKCGEYADSLHIAQFDMQDDVVGSYYMLGYSGGQPTMPTRFDIIMRHDSLFMHWTQERYADAYIHIPIDRTDCSLFIPSAFELYKDSRAAVRGYFYDTEGRMAGNGPGATARLSYSPGTGYNSATLVAAKWPGHVLNGFIIRNESMLPNILLQMGAPLLLTRIGPVGTQL